MKIGTEKTLVESTIDNLHPLIQREQVVISTSSPLEPSLRSVLPDVEFWTEPIPRDTAACIGYCTYRSLKHGEETVLIFVGSDYHIADKIAYQQHLSTAIKHAKQGKIVTLGIKPTRPATGFGYIQPGKKLTENDSLHSVYEVENFVEKPDHETALQYVEKGYFWNSGMFIVKASIMVEAFKKHLSKHHEVLEEMQAANFEPDKSLELFKTLERISIDYGIMEKEKSNLVVVRSAFGWDDLGDWSALERHYGSDNSGNINIGNNLLLETENSIIKSNEHLIVTYGVKDLVIVENKGAILVIPKDESQNIKRILAEMGKDEQFKKYL